ncbi:MAG TPA: hypothetical protein VIM09_00070 [Chthoniobacterales bacterium]
MRMSHEHERAKGRGWVDNQQDCPEGELRGQATLVKITEDVRKYAAEQGLAESEALEAGMEQKSKEFTAAGSEVYGKA